MANNLGVSLSNIQSYELGRRSPSDAFIKLICKEYGVNETWLLTGNGEMFSPLTEEQEKAQLLAAALDESVPHRMDFIRILSRLSDDTLNDIWEQLEAFFNERHPED